MRAIRPWIGFLLLCAGCSDGTNPSPKAPEQKSQSALTGWKHLKLGMSYDDALAALPRFSWNRYSLKQCAELMATDGCLLSSGKGETFAPIEGIAFAPRLSFNRFGELTDINLSYERRGRISRDECLELQERSLDRMTREVGEFRTPDDKKGEKIEKGWKREIRQTDQRNRYEVTSRADAFVTAPMRSHFKGVRFPNSKPLPEWNDQAYASLMTTFFMVDGDPICMVDVYYNASPKVPRRKLESPLS